MAPMVRMAGAAALGAAMLIGLSAPPAQAAYTAMLSQVGSNVVGTGSGSVDLTGLTQIFNLGDHASIYAGGAGLLLGPTSFSYGYGYSAISGPTSFGPGSTELYANSGSGNLVGIEGDSGLVFVSRSYVSGSSLGTSTDTWDNATFASLGLTPGTYVWTWGSGADADSFTLQIGPAAVPEPSSLALLALPLSLLMLRAARRRQA